MYNNLITVAAITFNSEKYIKDFLGSIVKSNVKPENIIVFDNNSKDKTIEIVKKFHKKINIISNNKNYGYAKSINKIFYKTKSELVLICNADTKFTKKSLKLLFDEIKKNKNVGCIGPQQVFPNLAWQRSGGDFPSFKDTFKNILFFNLILKHLHKIIFLLNLKNKIYFEYLDGAIMLIRRKYFNLVNKFDEKFFFYSEEVDFFYRLRKHKIKYYIFAPSKVIHFRGGHSIVKNFEKDKKFFKLKFQSRLIFLKKHRSKKYNYLLLRLEMLFNLYVFGILSILTIFNDKLKYKQKYFKFIYNLYLNEIKK